MHPRDHQPRDQRDDRGVGQCVVCAAPIENGDGCQPIAVDTLYPDPDLTLHPASFTAVCSSPEQQIEGETL